MLLSFPLMRGPHSRGSEAWNVVDVSFIPPYSIIAVELLPVVLNDIDTEVPPFTLEL
jgi:hypothetical protein